MFRLIKWIFSTITTIIVIGVIIYFFKFQIRGDSLCISLRHKAHKAKLEQIEQKLKNEVKESKQHLQEKLKKEIIKGIDNKPQKKKEEQNGQQQLNEFLKKHM